MTSIMGAKDGEWPARRQRESPSISRRGQALPFAATKVSPEGQSLTPCFGSGLLFRKFHRKAAIKALARGQSLDQFVA
jgi:hypothetical protein